MHKKELKEVEKVLVANSSFKQPSKFLPEAYIGSEYNYYKFLNIRVPKVRELRKKGYSFSNLELKERFKIWDYIWHNSDIFEAALSAAHFVNKLKPEELYQHRTKLLKWIKRIDNWALSDELSNIIAKLVEYKPSEFYPYMEKLNKSKEPWEVRLSTVGLLYYSRMRKKHLSYNKVIKLVDPHLSHPHYYVQKAVGWTLRECWNVYPEKTYAYLTKNAALIPTG